MPNATHRAAEVEGELRLITKDQDINVNKLVQLVKENETILVKMRVRANIHPSRGCSFMLHNSALINLFCYRITYDKELFRILSQLWSRATRTMTNQ